MTVQIINLRSTEFFMELLLEKAGSLPTGLVHILRVRKEIRLSNRPIILVEHANFRNALRRLLRSRKLLPTSMQYIYRLNDPKYRTKLSRKRTKKRMVRRREECLLKRSSRRTEKRLT